MSGSGCMARGSGAAGPCLSLLLALASFVPAPEALAKWKAASARPYLSIGVSSGEVSDDGLRQFSHSLSDTPRFTLARIELGAPLWDEVGVFLSYGFGGNRSQGLVGEPRLLVHEASLGLRWGYAIKSWLVPVIRARAGATLIRARAEASRNYAAQTWIPHLGGGAGIQLRSPALVIGKDPKGWFGQMSLSLTLIYQGSWRGKADLGRAAVSAEHESQRFGPHLGSLSLSDHGVDLRFGLQF